TRAFEGRADIRSLRPDALHTMLAAAPIAGSISAQAQGEGVRFDANIRATAPPGVSARTRRNQPAPLAINALVAQGQWQPAQQAPGGSSGGSSVRFTRLLLDALQARAESGDLRIELD